MDWKSFSCQTWGSHNSMDFWRPLAQAPKTVVGARVRPASVIGLCAGRIALSFDGREIYFTSWNDRPTELRTFGRQARESERQEIALLNAAQSADDV